MSEYVIRRLDDLGVTLFRINLSHTKIGELEEKINFIKKYTDVPICLDSEGAQIRSGKIYNGEVYIKDNSFVEIISQEIDGNNKRFNFTPQNIFNEYFFETYI